MWWILSQVCVSIYFSQPYGFEWFGPKRFKPKSLIYMLTHVFPTNSTYQFHWESAFVPLLRCDVETRWLKDLCRRRGKHLDEDSCSTGLWATRHKSSMCLKGLESICRKFFVICYQRENFWLVLCLLIWCSVSASSDYGSMQPAVSVVGDFSLWSSVLDIC